MIRKSAGLLYGKGINEVLFFFHRHYSQLSALRRWTLANLPTGFNGLPLFLTEGFHKLCAASVL